MVEFTGADECGLGENELIGRGDRENLQLPTELVRYRIARRGDAGAFVYIEQEGLPFGDECDGDIIGGRNTAEGGGGKNSARPFDAGGHGEELKGGFVLSGGSGEMEGIEYGQFGGFPRLIEAGDDEFGVAVEIDIEERECGEVAAVPVFTEDVALNIKNEQLAGKPEVMVGDGDDPRDPIGKATKDGKPARVEGRFKGGGGGLDGAAETAGPEHVAAGIKAVNDVIGVGQFASNEKLVGAVAIEIGLDGPGEMRTWADGGIGTGMESPGGAALFVESGDDAVVDGEVMKRGGAEVPPHGGGTGEEGEQNGRGVDEIGRRERGRRVCGAPGIDFGGNSEDAAVGSWQAADGKGTGPLPELDSTNGDAEVGGYFLPGLEFAGHRDRMRRIGGIAKRNEAKYGAQCAMMLVWDAWQGD